MSWLFGDTLSSSDPNGSPIGAVGEKVQRWTDPLSWITGGKWADLTSQTFPSLVNKGLGYVTKPIVKANSYIDPLAQTSLGKVVGNFISNKPGDTAAIAVGSIFSGGALAGAFGGAGEAGGAAAAGGAGAGTGGLGAGLGAGAGEAAGGGAASAGGFGGFGSFLGSDSLGGLSSGAIEGGGATAGGSTAGGLGGFFGGSGSLGAAGVGGGLVSGGGSGLSGAYGNALDAQAGQTGIFSGMPGSNGADLSGGAGGFDYQKFAQNELKNLSQNYAPQAQHQGQRAAPGCAPTP